MLCEAAHDLDLATVVLCERPSDPASRVATKILIGSATDRIALEELSRQCDVITFDHEHVDLEQLDHLTSRGIAIAPGRTTLEAATDKATMRVLFADAGFPLPAFSVVDEGETDAGITEAVMQLAAGVGLPLIVKPARGGYDGRGVFVERTTSDAISRVKLLSQTDRVLIEAALDLEAELAVLVARDAQGNCVVYPPVITTQVDGMCREVVVPCDLDDALADEAQLLAVDVAQLLDSVGILAVELFIVDDMAVICEVAARPHNSGHWTIEGTTASQFENHLRGVAGLGLSLVTVTAPAVAMVNIVGNDAGDDPADFVTGDDLVGLHLYGKSARAGRKLGHLTVLGDDRESVRATAWRAVQDLHGALPAQRQ
jgi:5-(carboxyamino)imidazole ribonucleotide synthase